MERPQGLAFANPEELGVFLLAQAGHYNSTDFIDNDPIAIPHQFTKLQDIEIAGFFAAILAWGNRKAILNSCRRLLTCMDNTPFDFVENFTASDLKPLEGFVHRTYNTIDLFHTLYFLKDHYRNSHTLEMAFAQFIHDESTDIKTLLTGFHEYFFDVSKAPERTRKHIASPARHSACKRLNMFLRWMVRTDDNGVDFGIWQKIKQKDLMIPLDLHSGRVARELGLLARKQDDWKAVEELTSRLRELDAADPVKYDFALFGMGVSRIL
ncbi:MAG TPA: TIGR02757 family protein [Edaphocola sp.]|nr:TIGR02757 family protein [Edaphocola sp.]